MRSRGRKGAAFVLLLAGTGALAAGCRGRRLPDILLVTVDTLRADRLGAYGSSLGLTPALDRFAAGSAVFENAWAAVPVTGPSLSTAFTAYYPHETRVTDNGVPIPTELSTLAGSLRARGYETVAVVANPVLGDPHRLETGFSIYDDAIPDQVGERGVPTRRARSTTDAALAVLRGRGGRPLFLWVHYMDPHGPYDAPPAMFERSERVTGAANRRLPINPDNRGLGGIPSYQSVTGCPWSRDYLVRYNAAIASLDGELGRLLGSADALRISETGLVLVTADHGEALGEHDVWFAHGENLYSEMLRVPLLARGSGIRPGGRRDPVSLLDLSPSVLEYAGFSPGSGRGLPVLRTPAPSDRVLFAATFPAASIATRYAAIGPRSSAILSEPGSWEYYEDSEQRRNLASSRPAGLRDLARRIRAEFLRDDLRALAIAPERVFSPESIRRLRSLGYLQ